MVGHKESSLFHQLLYSQALLLCKHPPKLVLNFVLSLIKPSFFILVGVKQLLKVIPFEFFLVFIRQTPRFFLQINWLFKYQLQSHQLLKEGFSPVIKEVVSLIICHLLTTLPGPIICCFPCGKSRDTVFFKAKKTVEVININKIYVMYVHLVGIFSRF